MNSYSKRSCAGQLIMYTTQHSSVRIGIMLTTGTGVEAFPSMKYSLSCQKFHDERMAIESRVEMLYPRI